MSERKWPPLPVRRTASRHVIKTPFGETTVNTWDVNRHDHIMCMFATQEEYEAFILEEADRIRSGESRAEPSGEAAG